MDSVAHRLLKQIADLEQKALHDQHYYRGCREGITLLLQEVKKAADEQRQREQPAPAPERSISAIRKKRKEAESGADEGR